MISEQFEQKAIQLVTVNEDGKYILHPDGEQFISKVQKPIAVVSVAGMYRTGKSYLLNRMLLNRSNGFGVGPTINPCTKGLWCWGTPIKGTNSNGEKVNVIIIDTEGIGALDEDQNHDTKIFTLAVLSASTFIYNSVGSIDQNALQNLSLIVNLSKNIQVNSQKSQEQQEDPQDLAQYFPSFCWVVRDFSLQLVTPTGEKITSRDYLQKALVQQKGFSDDIEQKNRIRRLLCAFFKQRDCMTMVRPLVNEAQLQNLEKLEFDDLRSEFVEQVLYLRKKILTKITPKTFKGKQLDGQMYLHILKSYIDAINDGAVPSIETAWTYMCQQKCMKTQQECWRHFQQQIELMISNGFPISQEDLSCQLMRLQEQCIKKFSKECVGEAAQDFLQQLKNKVKHKMREIHIQNQKQSISLLKSYVIKNFQSIQKRVTSNQFETFQDYLKCINTFAQNLKQKGPNYPKRDLVFLQFTKKFIAQGAERFLKNATQTYESSKALWQQMKNSFQKKIEDLKAELSKQVKTRKDKVKELDWENGQLIRNLQTCRSQINRMKQNEQRQKQATQIKMKQKVKEFQNNKFQLLSQITQIKSLVTQLQSQKYKLQKQLQKTKAINDQKLRQLTEELLSSKQKDKQNQIELNKLKYQMNFKIQEITSQYQDKLKKSLEENKKIMNSMHDLQDQNKSLMQNVTYLQSEFQVKIDQMSRQLKMKNQEFQTYKQKTESQMQKLKETYESQIEAQKQMKEEFEQKQSQNLSKLAELNQKIRNISTEHQKEVAVLSQSVSFIKMSMQQTKQIYQSKILSYESKIKQLQQMNHSILQTNQSQKAKQVQFQMREKFKALQTGFEAQKNKTINEMQEIKKNKERLELDLKLLKSNMQNQTKNLKTIIDELEQQLKSEIQKRQSIQNNYTEEFDEKIKLYEKKIEELQEQIQTIKESAENQQRVGTMRSQEAVIQLKNYYQMEKQNLEKKLLKQRQKYQKKLNELEMNYEQQKNMRIQELEDEFSEKFDQYDRKSIQDQEKINNLMYENASTKKMYEQLQKKYSEDRESFEKKETDYAKKVQYLSTNLQTQKQTSHSKLDDLTRQKNKLEKQLLTFNHQKQQFTVIIRSKDQKIQKMKIQISHHNINLEKAYQENRNKITQLTNQFIQKTINYQKDIALKQQQNQFIAKKLQEMQKNFVNLISNHQQSSKRLKEDYGMSIKSVEQKKNQEILLLEDKYDRLKKSSKQNDLMLQKKVNLLEKQIAIQKEKTTNLELRLKDYQEKITTDQDKFSSQLNNVRSMLISEKKELVEKYESVKISLSQSQNEKQQLLATYQREKVLWENKNVYLEQSKEKTKKQLNENIKRLEQNIENLQKLRMSQKSNNQTSSNQYIAKIEKKYWDQIKEITQNNSKKELQFEQTRKKLQSQIRSLTQRLAMETQNKSDFSVTNQRRLKQLIEKQKKQSQQLERLKSQKQQTAQQSYVLIQKQKDNYKAKLQEKEDKIRLLQKQKQEMLFEFQKDKAKMNIQKQSLAIKVEDYKDTSDKSKRQIQKMRKQLDKYKSDRRNSRMTHNIGNLSRYSNLRPLEDSTLLNSSINSSSTNKDRKSSSGLDQSSMLDMSIASNYKEQSFSGFDQISKIKMNTNYSHSSYLREGKSFSKAKDFGKELKKNKQNIKILDDDEHDFFGEE